MKFKSLILIAMALCIVSEVTATFNLCGHNTQQEVDVCNTCQGNRGGITAPRPHRLTPPRMPTAPLIRTICRQESTDGPKPFNPIGDACSCGQQIVKPAPLPNIPRPSVSSPIVPNSKSIQEIVKFGKCLPSLPSLRLPCSCSACTPPSEPTTPATPRCGSPVRAPEEYQIYNDKAATIYLDSPKKTKPAPPSPQSARADVISVAIARQLADQAKNSVSEKQLQYGSLKEPTIPERSEKKVINNINEESFYETKGDVLEIKSNMFHRKQVSSESESSEEEEVKPKVVEPFSPPQLKYQDIGYSAYKPSDKPRYVVVKNSKPAKHDCPHATRRPHHRRNHSRNSGDCGCHKDLVVDQSEISEQSVSYENNSEQHFLPRGPLRT